MAAANTKHTNKQKKNKKPHTCNYERVLLLGRVLGRELWPLPGKFGTFSLEVARFRANSVVYFNRNVRQITATTTTGTVYCLRLTGSSYWGGFLGGGSDPSPGNFVVLFHLKWLNLVQIHLYFNRNVRQFTARTTTVTCIHVLLAAFT